MYPLMNLLIQIFFRRELIKRIKTVFCHQKLCFVKIQNLDLKTLILSCLGINN